MANYRLERVSWRDSKILIDSMYAGNEFLSPYSSFDFLNHIIHKPNIRLKKQYKKCLFHTYVLFRDNQPVYVAPLFFDLKEKVVYLAGHFNSVGHTDFIYGRDVTKDDFTSLLEMMKSEFRGCSVLLDRISQFSKTFAFITDKGYKPIEEETCVKIDFGDHDEWFSSLSKSCRQNIRTAYNRIAREKLDFCFLCFLKEKPARKYYNDHISLFSKRILEHSKLTKLLYLPLRFFKKRDSLSKALFDYQDIIFSGVYLNKKLIGTLDGVVANDGRAIITRLSINVKFGVYCPGGLLINETIKALSNQSKANIISLDLSRGDEKYKYTYGGKDHHNYTFRIGLNDNENISL